MPDFSVAGISTQVELSTDIRTTDRAKRARVAGLILDHIEGRLPTGRNVRGACCVPEITVCLNADMEQLTGYSNSDGGNRAWDIGRHHLHIDKWQPGWIVAVNRVPKFSVIGNATNVQLLRRVPQAGTIYIDKRAWEACQFWL